GRESARTILCRAGGAGAEQRSGVAAWARGKDSIRPAAATAPASMDSARDAAFAAATGAMMKLADEYRLCAVSEPPELTGGLDAMVERMIGTAKGKGRALRRLQAQAERVMLLEEKFKALDEAALQSRIADLREQFRRETKTRPAPVEEGLAAAREVAARRL